MRPLETPREVRLWLALAASVVLGACSAGSEPGATQTSDPLSAREVSRDFERGFAPPTHARVVAQGIPGAGAVTQIGTFHRGSPFHDKAPFAALTAPGMILDGKRLFVASSSSFGAPLARPSEAPGCVLSLDVSQGLVTVPSDLAVAGGQAATADGRARVYAGADAAFLNSINNPAAATAALPAASLPLGISLNRGNGRPWIANAPSGASGAGTITVDDPSGAPLAGAPDPVAGGVFSGDATNRGPASTEGLDHGAVATAIMTKSPDGTGKAVFLAAEADGSIVQVHVLKGVDALAPAGTFTPLPALTVAATQSTDRDAVTRVGLAFNWVPTRIAYVTDPLADRVVALDLSDDGTLFATGAPRVIRSRWFDRPVDIAPATVEVAADNFASNTTLGGGSDLYVLNRGNATIVRITQAGDVVAVRRVVADLPPFRVNGLAVSEDAQTLWVTAVMDGGDGAVLELPAFGDGLVTPTMVDHARRAGAADLIGMGADMFATDLSPLQLVGPLFNGRACGDCHNDPIQGGMGATADTFVTRVGRVANGMFDPLVGLGGPVARAHSISELGFPCGLRPGLPPLANVTSKRSAMTLRGTALMDFVQNRDILAAQAAEPAAVRGKVNVLGDGRLGRFGWKAQFATLVEFMGDAFTHEMGVTNPLVPRDEVRACGAALVDPEIDAVPVQAVTAFMNTLDPAVPDATTCLASAGATTFTTLGCAGCHTPSFPGPGRTINLYSDLLVHDMGAAFDDHFVAGSAGGSEWRTAPLWRASDRVHFLHDGRAATLSDAIAAHGGQAAPAAAGFAALDATTRQALLDFLGCI
ncbi:MAG TPA: di-heme oxidoredictase family protein [Polyangia bacterium]|nr:di-heme oxidoredictase family protein [Polyangia bacterium]